MVYTFFKAVSNALALSLVMGFLNKSPYTNIWLTAYGVVYTINVGTAWSIFSPLWPAYLQTVGEGINVIACALWAKGIWELGQESEANYKKQDDEE